MSEAMESPKIELKIMNIEDKLQDAFYKYIEGKEKQFDVERENNTFCIYDKKNAIQVVCTYDKSQNRIPINVSIDHEKLAVFLQAEGFEVVQGRDDRNFAIVVDKKDKAHG